MAHRGGAALAPENTLAACAQVLARGADAIEVDVRLTADGVPVLLHDATLDRTTNGRGPLAALAAAQVAALDATIAWRRRRATPEPPPTLAATLALIADRVPLFLDLKGDPRVPAALVTAVLAAQRAAGARRVTLLSFDWSALLQARTLAPGVSVGALAAWWPPGGVPALARLAAAGIEWLGLHHRVLTPQRAGAVRAAGLRLYVWTVNDSRALRRVAPLGADAIATDHPAWLKARLAPAHASP